MVRLEYVSMGPVLLKRALRKKAFSRDVHDSEALQVQETFRVPAIF